MADVTRGRWKHAQEYERNYWRGRAREIEDGGSQLDWYGWRADQLSLLLGGLDASAVVSGDSRVLEIGSGPVGVSSFLSAGTRVAIDPLAAFYSADSALIDQRSDSTVYVAGMGEDLPFATGTFDLLIMENCIDHVRDVDSVMTEISRVLRSGGLLYFTVNVRTTVGRLVHRTLSRARIDGGHPHSFNVAGARSLLAPSVFELLYSRVGNYREALFEDLASPEWKTRLKGLIGVSEFLVTLVAARR